MSRLILTFRASLFLVSLSLPGCQCTKEPKTSVSAMAQETLAARGRVLYLSHCIACHNQNPKLNGSLGPDVWGSSKELLEARVVHGTYPAGYTPKRQSQAMPAMPHLAKELDAIVAFLSAIK